MMHINNLSLIRQKKVLLHPTSFIIEPNKLYALIGHNGSGKSSLIKAMAGEMTPRGGRHPSAASGKDSAAAAAAAHFG